MKQKRKPQAQKTYVPKERYGSSGYGFHSDRRTKRESRRTQLTRELRDWGY